ncbi:MAG TPA: DNA repair protein RecN [Methylococcus sp.]|nr:DNA repair protein RecN [Methylococcus sp.]
MLVSLSIRDLAVVASLDLEFHPGFTVLTGETGAGKSILLTALGLALGDRADTGFVRPGAERAEVSLLFDLGDAATARDWLREHELIEADSEECLIRRIVTTDGRSRAFINGRPVTLQSLQGLGRHLLEIHGQHAHLHLLQSGEQRQLLDRYAGNDPLTIELTELFKRWKSVMQQLTGLHQDAGERLSRLELLEYQIEELEQEGITELDYAALCEEHELLANLDKILAVGQAQLGLLYEDEAMSVNGLLTQSIQAFGELTQSSREFALIRDLLESARIQVKEAASELRHQLNHLEPDPARLTALERRLAEIHQLARKHHVRPQELPDRLAQLKDEWAALTAGSEQLELLERERDALLAAYTNLAERLSTRRRQAASELQDRVSRLIQELGMPQGRFEISIERQPGDTPSPHGWDAIEFQVSANPGLPLRPLSRIASGGELSRISLAIEVAVLAQKTTPTLIYDEIDTGIGGRVAEIVGQKLRTLGNDRQVFCVTHLPQIAAQGHHHLLVEKSAHGGITRSVVRALRNDERTREIARMLGGVRITDQALAHAQEMLTLAQ